MLLAATTASLRLTTSAPVAIDVSADFIDHGFLAGTIDGGSVEQKITTATTTTIVAAPATNIRRRIKYMAFTNVGGSSNTLTVLKTVSGVDYTQMTIVLGVGQSLVYSEATGFEIVDVGSVPSGSSKSIQYNDSGSFGGATKAVINANGSLEAAEDTTPITPSSGYVGIFGRKVGGRMMIAMIGPSGLDTVVQPHLGRNKVARWIPAGNSTTIVADGAAALTSTGTATAANVATTNLHTWQKRVEFLVTVAATNAVAGWWYSAAQWAVGGTTALAGGFHYVCRWGPATGVSTTTNRAFVGMANSTAAPTDVEPSTQVNCCGVGWDAADTNMQFMYNDGAGTCTKIDLGASFPVPTVDRTESYELAMFAPPGGTQSLSYEVTNNVTGAKATGTVTTDLPSTSTLLAPRGWMSVGGTSSVIGVALSSLTIESDY